MNESKRSISDSSLDEHLEQLHQALKADSAEAGDDNPQQLENARKVLGLIQRVRQAETESCPGDRETKVDQQTPNEHASSTVAVSSSLVDQAIQTQKLDRYIIVKQLLYKLFFCSL